MNKAVIFDLDGTLIDSLPDIFEHVNITLEKYGAPKKDKSLIRQYIGNGARNLILRSFDHKIESERADEILAFYNKSYTESDSPKTQLFSGIKEVLLELKKRGYKLGILTNKPQLTTDDVYKTYLSEIGFDAVVGYSAGRKIKPDPEALFDMLKGLDVSIENAYFVGDGETDVEVAINAKVNGIAVLWGYRDKDQLLLAGAKAFADKPSDLLEFIK
ncbi:MAG: HAD family hydrolase [Clostridia bacterium]|nr:HAD family hydrolase [Clostridia bacterium]